MSESQRRYIYRLVAARGVTPDGTAAYLADHLGVNLTTLTRLAATKLIDELLATTGGEVAGRGAPVR